MLLAARSSDSDSTNSLLKHGLRLIDVNVRAGRSQEEGQGSFVDNSDEGSFGFQGQRLHSLCRYEE